MAEMEIKNRKSEEVVAFLDSLDEILNSIKFAFENRTPTLGGDKYLTNRDVVNMLHISPRTLQDWRDTGRIPYIQISGKVLYKESDVERLLEENYFTPPAL